jgi:hypothetical protein
MGRGYFTKDLSDNLAPLNRYLAAHVGRPWRSVHAEIAEHLSFRNVTQAHIYQHLREMLSEHVVMIDGGAITFAREPRSSARPQQSRAAGTVASPPVSRLRRSRRSRARARLGSRNGTTYPAAAHTDAIQYSPVSVQSNER